MIYTETFIHLSVGESGGYLPPLRLIIVKYTSLHLFSEVQLMLFFIFSVYVYVQLTLHVALPFAFLQSFTFLTFFPLFASYALK